MSGRGRLLGLAVAVLTLAGCSTVPTSSPTVPITQVPSRQDADVGIEPLAPEQGASPEEIVRGFIDASASSGRGHPVAREYLTPKAQESWADAGGVTVIEPGFATVTRDEGVVRLSARTVGTVDERGIFTVGGERFVRDFTVQDVDGEWRLADPADGLVVLEPDFERVYDQLDAFFLDPTGKRVVPDPRYLVVGEAQPTALVQRLFDGPSPTLRAGVENPMQGLALRRPVTVDGSTATVDLTGLPADPEPPLRQICAQLVWTLEQSRIRSVEVLVEGEPVSLPQVPREQTTDDWAAYDPDAVPVSSVGHYVDDGALRTAPDGDPVPGPAGEGAYALTSATASSDQSSGELSFLAAVTAKDREGDVALLAGPYGGELAPVLPGSRSLTAPTVAATRSEIWTVRNRADVFRVLPGATPQEVSAPSLPTLGDVTRLQLSPDGVRAAMVIDGGSGHQLYLGTVVRSDEGAVALGDLREVNQAIEEPIDVAWRSSDTLILLADNPSGDGVVPYEVGVDGWGLAEVPTSGLPADPVTIAAAPNQEPLVSAEAPGGKGDPTIWRLIGVTWVTLVLGAPPQPGTEPFYPL